MEFGIVLLAVLGASVACVWGVTTEPEVTGLIGEATNLLCSGTGNVDQLILVQLRRKQEKGNPDEVLVNLLRDWNDNSFSPRWASTIDPSFHSRVLVTSSVENNVASINLQIKTLECQDIGEYVCMAQNVDGFKESTTSLKVEAKPMKPTIHYQTLIVQPDTPFTLQCDGNVGRPPAMLRWLIKSPTKPEEGFSLVNIQPPQEIEASDDCRYRAKKTLKITINKESSGTIYRCEVVTAQNRPEDPQYYDEVTVLIEPVPEPAQPTYAVTCEGEDCSRPIQDSNKAETVSHNSVLVVFLLSVLTVFARCL